MFKPNLSVKEALDHLAKRLDPIIAEKLSHVTGGHPWTVVLEILDEKKGYSRAYQHWTHDLQAQLRILTERLGTLGYPFDDEQRTVSTLGNELRVVRKQMAHMHEFSVEEAFRTSDFCVRLLEFFNDRDGLVGARSFRLAALTALAAEEGVTDPTVPAAIAQSRPVVVAGFQGSPRKEGEPDSEREYVAPDPEVFEREPSVIGAMRLEFDPWTVVPAGTVEVLDDLPKKAAKEKVRAVAVEIATYEGPVHLDRLVLKTAQSFGLQRLRSGREKKIAYQVQQAGLFVDSDRFVWPREIDVSSWAEFRPNDSKADRPFVHISPVEIANAARFIKSKHPGIADDDLDAAVLQTFGRKRRTKQVAAHLAKAKECR